MENIILVDSIAVKVSVEVYKAYSKLERRERYMKEHDLLSLDMMADSTLSSESPMYLWAASTEDEVVRLEDAAECHKKLVRFMEALDKRSRTKNARLYFEGLSMREIARQEGVYPRTITYRMEKARAELRKMIVFEYL